MSCLLRILTGAGNVGHTQCECPGRKADRRGEEKSIFIPIQSIYLRALRCIQEDTPVILIKTSIVRKRSDKRLFCCCIVGS